MVTLQTMETSAAPMAPMMAAALPPPGVGLPLGKIVEKFFNGALSDHELIVSNS